MEKTETSDNKYLAEQLQRARRDLAVLYEISNAMRTSLDLDQILFTILTGVTAHTGLGFNRAIIFLVNHKERCLEPKMAIGPESGEHAQKIWQYISASKKSLDDLIKTDNLNQAYESSLFKSIKDLRIPLDADDKNVLSYAYRLATPLHIPPEKISYYAQSSLLQVFKANELVIVPLKAKDKVNGLIVADNLFTQKTITVDDLKIFIMLANQAGLAIENAHLYEMIKHQSHTDAVTGLWNHGFFQEQLTEAVKKAQSEKTSLGLMMIDIDDFKPLNDTYGHQNGDFVLKEIATILKESYREMDFVCRYGGEEFTIILPQTNKDQAYAIAERLRQRIEAHSFVLSSPAASLKVTVSVGVAVLPDDAKTKLELIAKADKAMYTAKFGGKNQICVAE
jgi:diguanylate cyclase (GGDEF)-like protein